METKRSLEAIPPMKAGQWNNYRPEDVKRWGIERFLDEVASKATTKAGQISNSPH